MPLTWWSVSSEALQKLKSLPMSKASTCGQVLALAWVQVLQNSGLMVVLISPGTRVEKTPLWATVFSVFSGIQEKTQAKLFELCQLPCP